MKENRGGDLVNKVILGLVLTSLSGCALPYQGGPSSEEFAQGDFGSQPTNYEQTVREYMNNSLKDPFSAQYQFGQPEKAWYGNPGGLLVSRDIRYGWGVLVRVNAKNSFGAYVGWRNYGFYFKNNRLDWVITPQT